VASLRPQGGGSSLREFQNLGYTLEWFVFAGFVVFMWFRLVRREAEAAQDRAIGLDPLSGHQASARISTPRASRPCPDGPNVWAVSG
jgi:hypothetical protein